ncbi:MAG: hypothetical protein WBP08_16875 [Saprospiraceae bacterium]
MKPLKSNEHDIFLLDQYIKGQLSKSQQLDTQQRLLSDVDLRTDYEYLLKVAADARISSLYEVNQILIDAEKEFVNRRKGIMSILISQWKKYLVVAILFSGLLYLGIKYLGTKKVAYPEQYADIFEKRFDSDLILHETYRAVSQTDGLSTEQRRAYELYSIQKFEKSAPLLQKLWETKNDTLALYYWGISEIGRGNVEKGKEILVMEAVNEYPKIIK